MPTNSLLLLDRRRFLEKSGLLAGAALFLSPWQRLVAGVPASPRTDVPLTADDRAVLRFVSSYGRNYSLQNGSVVGKGSDRPFPFTKVMVEMDDLCSLQEAWRKHPFVLVYARKNTLSFVQGDTFFAIEHLRSPEFQRRSRSRESAATQPAAPENSDVFSFLRFRIRLAQARTILPFTSTIG